MNDALSINFLILTLTKSGIEGLIGDRHRGTPVGSGGKYTGDCSTIDRGTKKDNRKDNERYKNSFHVFFDVTFQSQLVPLFWNVTSLARKEILS